MKLLLLLLLAGCVTEPQEPSHWTGKGYVTFGAKSSDTVDCELVLNGNSGTLTMKKDTSILLQDTLFNILIDNFKYLGSVRGKYDTSQFEFYEFNGQITGEYGLEPDNGVYRIRHFTLHR